jgi:hypothetical protein
MKLAVIVLAHLQEPAGVALLCEYFSAINASLFVHVDAKVDDSAYRSIALGQRHVELVSNPLKVYWGGFNTVRAIIRSLEFAAERGHFDRFTLITENSIPLVKPDDLIAMLSSDVEYMHLIRRPPAEVHKRYEGFYFFDCFAMSPRHCEPVLRELTDDVLHDIERLKVVRSHGKCPVDLHHGSTYWALSRRAIEAVLESYHHHVDMRESFEFSAIPEEQYFHTILGNAFPDREFVPWMYADFSRPPYPYVFSKRAEILDRPRPAGAFLRKTDMRSPELVDFVHDLLAT